MNPTASSHLVPTSFGAFKPVGWLMIGVPTPPQAEALVPAFESAGWPAADVLNFAPSESLPELEAMVDKAGAMAGFGFEITLLRRYVGLARAGYRWLLVKVDSAERAAAAAEIARSRGATLAVHYRMLTVEELI
jgi:hypothetical protein